MHCTTKQHKIVVTTLLICVRRMGWNGSQNAKIFSCVGAQFSIRGLQRKVTPRPQLLICGLIMESEAIVSTFIVVSTWFTLRLTVIGAFHL